MLAEVECIGFFHTLTGFAFVLFVARSRSITVDRARGGRRKVPPASAHCRSALFHAGGTTVTTVNRNQNKQASSLPQHDEAEEIKAEAVKRTSYLGVDSGMRGLSARGLVV